MINQVNQPLLVLFDVDGTLFLDAGHSQRKALVESMRAVYGVALADDAVLDIVPHGKTDLLIMHQVLSEAGLSGDEIAKGREEWLSAVVEVFSCQDVSQWKLRDGMKSALYQLSNERFLMSLLTGNVRDIAKRKMTVLVIDPYLDLIIGAYGNESENRNDLPLLARARAGAFKEPWPQTKTVIVGDTPNDIACASADMCRSIIFASELYTSGDLSKATEIVTTTDEMVSILRSWQSQTSF